MVKFPPTVKLAAVAVVVVVVPGVVVDIVKLPFTVVTEVIVFVPDPERVKLVYVTAFIV